MNDEEDPEPLETIHGVAVSEYEAWVECPCGLQDVTVESLREAHKKWGRDTHCQYCRDTGMCYKEDAKDAERYWTRTRSKKKKKVKKKKKKAVNTK